MSPSSINSPDPTPHGESGNEQLLELLVEYELGTLDADGVQQLQTLLKSSAAARQQFANWQTISFALRLKADCPDEVEYAESAGGGGGDTERSDGAVVSRRGSSGDRFIPGRVWATVATVLFLLLAGYLFFQQFGDASTTGGRPGGSGSTRNDAVVQNQEQMSEGVAILTRLVDVQFATGTVPREAGDAITTGRFAIESGFAQIEFFSGATVVVEGPAEMIVESSLRARVVKGRLRAMVPEVARGFTLEVDDLKIVDLGTEFGVDVQDNRTDVQVFAGEVEIHEPTDDPSEPTITRVRGGGAVIHQQGAIRTADADPSGFVGMSELANKENAQVDQRFARWKKWSDGIRNDPRVIAYYPFDQQDDWNRKLDCAATARLFEQSGAIVGAKRVPGRWPEKSGLEFKRPGDRVRMKVPGEFTSLTFMAWVRIDSLDRMYNSLFLTDNYNQGEPHWQILETGQLFFSVRWRPDDWVPGKSPNGPAHFPVISPPFWKPSLGGKWIHLATTFDAKSNRVVHFLNGYPIHQESIPDSLMVRTTRIGEATLGNWSRPTRPDEQFAIRNLNGTMDELLILNTALSADEVLKIYKIGKP